MNGFSRVEMTIHVIVIIDAINESGDRGMDASAIGIEVEPYRTVHGRSDTPRALKVFVYRWMEAAIASGYFEYVDDRKPRMIRRVKRGPR